MSRYFHRDTSKGIAPLGWFARGHWYDNSAAKFWSGILRELADAYPDARTVSFTLSHAPLHEGLYRCHIKIELKPSVPSRPC